MNCAFHWYSLNGIPLCLKKNLNELMLHKRILQLTKLLTQLDQHHICFPTTASHKTQFCTY